MVVYSNAIVDPWAVMVKSLNALVAGVAVTRAGSSNHKTVWTKSNWVN